MFEWDDDKNAANLLKHGLSFDEARLIFDGPVLSKIDARLNMVRFGSLA
ncbi:BrnT family toxin [Pararhizobium sp. O133]